MGSNRERFFDFVTGYEEMATLPVRMTENAAGYDLFCAEDTIVPSLFQQQMRLDRWYQERPNLLKFRDRDRYNEVNAYWEEECQELRERLKPVMIPLGVKASFPKDEYLEIVLRSSAPKKLKIMIPNSVGVIDADYYNNPENEGHIHLIAHSLDVVPVTIKAGERIAQGIFKRYYKTKGDQSVGKRTGGFGSTGLI
ncbi:dUTP diphosphatase [Enterococcus sp. DIV0800]|uniref:dUTP diphosphatase n=1 Tax=unclassified Enterococcus TaxID=2608891 RepID=UPI003D2FCB73